MSYATALTTSRDQALRRKSQQLQQVVAHLRLGAHATRPAPIADRTDDSRDVTRQLKKVVTILAFSEPSTQLVEQQVAVLRTQQRPNQHLSKRLESSRGVFQGAQSLIFMFMGFKSETRGSRRNQATVTSASSTN